MRRALHWTICWVMLMGCQHFERADQCRALADGVNPELEELSNKYGRRDPASSEEYRTVSALYARAAKRLQNVKLKDTELARLARELSDNLVSVSRSYDRLSSVAKTAGRGSDSDSQRELENLTQHHHSTVSAIDRRCLE